MKVDVHNHALPRPALDLLDRDETYGVTVAGDRWHGGVVGDFTIAPAFFSAEQKLHDLEVGGMDGAVLSVAPMIFYHHIAVGPAEALAREANRGLAEMCAEAPDRLWWMATLPMQDPPRALAVLEEAAGEGCVGVEIATSVNGGYPDEQVFESFWSAVERLGLTVMLHPAFDSDLPSLAPYYLKNVIGHLFETTVAAERLICARTLDRHRDVCVVLVHGGGYLPYQLGRLRHAGGVRRELASAPADPWRYAERLVCDTITHDRDALGYLVGRMGAEHVVLGTDLPFDMADREPLKTLVDAVGEDAARVVAEDTPARLFRLNERSEGSTP